MTGQFIANQIIQSLCVVTLDGTERLRDFTNKIDIRKDAEKLKFKYEQGHLVDVSSAPSTLLSVRQLLEVRCSFLGAVYTKRQRQRQLCDNAAITLAIVFSLITMESCQIGFAPHFQATSLFSMRTQSQESSQRYRRVDGDAWYKQALKRKFSLPLFLV